MADGAVGVPDTTEVGEAGAAEADAAGTVMSLADGEAAVFTIFCTCRMSSCHGSGCFSSSFISSLFRRTWAGFSLILLSGLFFLVPVDNHLLFFIQPQPFHALMVYVVLHQAEIWMSEPQALPYRSG